MGTSFKSLFNHGDEVVEVKVMNTFGEKLEVRRFNKADQNEVDKMYKWLKDKYGIIPKIDNSVEKESDWLGLDNEFLKF